MMRPFTHSVEYKKQHTRIVEVDGEKRVQRLKDGTLAEGGTKDKRRKSMRVGSRLGRMDGR